MGEVRGGLRRRSRFFFGAFGEAKMGRCQGVHFLVELFGGIFSAFDFLCGIDWVGWSRLIRPL